MQALYVLLEWGRIEKTDRSGTTHAAAGQTIEPSAVIHENSCRIPSGEEPMGEAAGQADTASACLTIHSSRLRPNSRHIRTKFGPCSPRID